MSGSWGCPHELNDLCTRVNNLPCDPGMKGCVLYGRFVFANDEKNVRPRQKRALSNSAAASPDTGTGDDAGE
jgi:orotidine-5'-phosphate decarboxylase